MGGRIKALFLYYLIIIGTSVVFIELIGVSIILFHLVCPIFAEIALKASANKG